MNELNSKTKRAQRLINSYKRATATKLDEVYKSYSAAKNSAFTEWRIVAADRVGYVTGSFRITAAGSEFFSLGFLTRENGVTLLHYITYADEYIIKYEG